MTNLEKKYTSDLAEERRLLQCENAELRAGNARLREALGKHHKWQLDIGVVVFPSEKNSDGAETGDIELDLSAEYCDSTLYKETMNALAESPAVSLAAITAPLEAHIGNLRKALKWYADSVVLENFSDVAINALAASPAADSLAAIQEAARAEFNAISENEWCVVPPNCEAPDHWTIFRDFDGEFGYDHEIGHGATLAEAVQAAIRNQGNGGEATP